MSHLAHIVRVKEKLHELGVNCPIQQKSLLNNAYIDAIVAHHFTTFPGFNVCEDMRWKYETKIDCWNSVSPLDYNAVRDGYVSRINELRGQLSNTGRACTPPVVAAAPPKNETFCVTELPEYHDLVRYLFSEIRNCHE